MKKVLAFIVATVIVLLLFGCSKSKSDNTDQYIASGMESTQISPTSNSEPSIKDDKENAIGTDAKVEQKKITWNETTFNATDSEGYTYEIKVKASPWILYSNTKIITEAWDEITKNHSLPELSDWNLKKGSKGYYSSLNAVKDGATSFRRTDSGFNYSMFDMYYCVGSLSIINTTQGWDIDSRNPRSFTFALCPFKCDDVTYDKKNGEDYVSTIGRVFYNNSQTDKILGVRFSPSMTKNQWGSVPFVIMAPESKSPSEPNGFYELLKNKGCLVLESVNSISFEKINKIDEKNIGFYPGIIGESGEYESAP